MAKKTTKKKTGAGKKEVKMDRRSAPDRRTDDRRQKADPVASDRRKGERRNVQRRRQIDPTTCERDYSNDEIEFMRAMDEYKRASGRMFPTCSEILEVIRSLGYVRPEGAPVVSPEEAALLAASGAASDNGDATGEENELSASSDI